MKWWAGLVALGAGAGAGAAIGALTAVPCQGQGDAAMFCGPKWGALGGAAVGLLVTGVAGLGAALDKDYRAPGLTAAGEVGALVLASAAKRHA